jgi:hypothetical protein
LGCGTIYAGNNRNPLVHIQLLFPSKGIGDLGQTKSNTDCRHINQMTHAAYQLYGIVEACTCKSLFRLVKRKWHTVPLFSASWRRRVPRICQAQRRPPKDADRASEFCLVAGDNGVVAQDGWRHRRDGDSAVVARAGRVRFWMSSRDRRPFFRRFRGGADIAGGCCLPICLPADAD